MIDNKSNNRSFESYAPTDKGKQVVSMQKNWRYEKWP